MHYAEERASAVSGDLIKAFWRLDVGKCDREWIENDATPDGAVEVIWRLRGESIWDRAQPSVFAAGLTTFPARLQMRGDAIFRAVRLWPWTWRLLGGPPCAGFVDDWTPLSEGSTCHAVATRLDDDGAVEALVLDAAARAPNEASVRAIGRAVLQSLSVSEVAARTGLSHRSLQRWARTYIGLPLSTYLRLLRFQSALMDIQSGPETIAQLAAANGYADQAHMARSFREFAGKAPMASRSKARGPFLDAQSRQVVEER